MKIRTDLISNILQEIYFYDLNDNDIDFYYDLPKITFQEDGNMVVGDQSEDEGIKKKIFYSIVL